MKKLFVVLIALLMLATSCAENKTLNIDGSQQVVEPYGWANKNAKKVDGVVYQVSVGNVVWSIILSETIIVPVVLTGYYLFEPVRVEKPAKQ